METRNLDTAIVIPAHREGLGIIHTLGTIATQRNIQPHRVGIFVVVNEQRGAPPEITDLNRQTAYLVRALMSGVLPEDLSDTPMPAFSYDSRMSAFQEPVSQKRAAVRVLRALDRFLELQEVNLWEGEKAPEVCNVGVACDLGVREALSRLKNEDCPIMRTDADTLLHPDKVHRTIDAFRRDPTLMALRGETTTFSRFDTPKDFIQFIAFRIMGFLNYIQALQIALDRMMEDAHYFPAQFFESQTPLAELIHNAKVDKDTLIMAGPDTAFRARAYRDAQIPQIAGDEDTQFSNALRRAGYDIEVDSGLLCAVASRFSDRATTGHGRSLLAFEKYWRNPAKIPTLSLRHFKRFRDLMVKFLDNHGLIALIDRENRLKRYNPQFRENLTPYFRSHEFHLTAGDIFEIITAIEYSSTTTDFSERIMQNIAHEKFSEGLGLCTTLDRALDEILEILKRAPELRRGLRGGKRKELLRQAESCKDDFQALCSFVMKIAPQIAPDQTNAAPAEQLSQELPAMPSVACR